MLGQLDCLLTGTARGRRGGCFCHRPGELRIGPVGGERQMHRAQLEVGDRLGQGEMELAPLAGPRPIRRGGREQRVGRSDPVPVDHQKSGLGRLLDLVGARNGRELGRVQVGAERDRQQQPPWRGRQPGNSRAEHVLHAGRHREVGADLRWAVLHHRAADLEREQGIAERGFDQTAQEGPRQAHSEPLGQEPARRVDVSVDRPPCAAGLSARAPARRRRHERDAWRAGTRWARPRGAGRRTRARRRTVDRATGRRRSRPAPAPWRPGRAVQSGSRGRSRVVPACRPKARHAAVPPPTRGAEEPADRPRRSRPGPRRGRSGPQRSAASRRRSAWPTARTGPVRARRRSRPPRAWSCRFQACP